MEASPPQVPSPPTPPAPARRLVPDAGSPRTALIALICSIITVGAVMISQQLSVAELSNSKVPPKMGDTSMFDIFAKGYLKVVELVAKDASPQEKKTLFKPIIDQLGEIAQSPSEKLKAAIVGGELGDARQSLDMLNKAEEWVNKQSKAWEADHTKGIELDAATRTEFDGDLALLKRVYSAHDAGQTGTAELSGPDAQLLKDRFGWFGRLAAVFGDKAAPDRTALFVGGPWLIVIMFIFMAVAVIALLAGCALALFVLYKLLSGQVTWRFVPPAPGGSVYLETLAVFAASFFALKIVLALLAKVLLPKGTTEAPEWFGVMHLGLQWLLALVPLYPLLRGVSFSQWRADIGFVAPRGVLREIAAGFVAYLAGIPVFVCGVLVSLILKFILEAIRSAFGSDAHPPASNPIFEELLGSNGILLFLLFTLATIWAPFVEESIFRGALYRHLRSRVGLIIAGGVSAIAFGVMHGYEFVLLGPVISLGFVFAMMREWRQSIIPSITAHMLHNGTVMVLAISVLRLINQ